MVQVIVKRQNQKATVDCSKVKGYVLGNGPSRSNLNLDDLKNDGIVYGCNALYRDWEPDFLFANDFRQIRQIFLDEFKGQCVFSDMDILPVMYFDDIFEGIRSSLPPHVAIKMNYYGDRDNATDFCYMGYENKHDIIWINQNIHTNYEWGFKPLKDLPSTGIMALLRAVQNEHKEIIMYGFDGLKSGNYRNIYDGSYLYKFDARSHDGMRHPESYRPFSADDWEKNFQDIVQKYPNTKIEIV